MRKHGGALSQIRQLPALPIARSWPSSTPLGPLSEQRRPRAQGRVVLLQLGAERAEGAAMTRDLGGPPTPVAPNIKDWEYGEKVVRRKKTLARP